MAGEEEDARLKVCGGEGLDRLWDGGSAQCATGICGSVVYVGEEKLEGSKNVGGEEKMRKDEREQKCWLGQSPYRRV
jgi:hypothetical protein